MAEFKILRFPGGTGLEICVSEGQVSSLETKKSKVQMCAEEEQWINWCCHAEAKNKTLENICGCSERTVTAEDATDKVDADDLLY